MTNQEIKKVIVPRSELPQIGTAKIIRVSVSYWDISDPQNIKVRLTYTTSSPHLLRPGTRVKIFGLRPYSFNTSEDVLDTVVSIEGSPETSNQFSIIKVNQNIANNTVSDTGGYVTTSHSSQFYVRYRIISDTGGERSMWSPLFTVENNYIDQQIKTVSGASEGADTYNKFAVGLGQQGVQ